MTARDRALRPVLWVEDDGRFADDSVAYLMSEADALEDWRVWEGEHAAWAWRRSWYGRTDPTLGAGDPAP